MSGWLLLLLGVAMLILPLIVIVTTHDQGHDLLHTVMILAMFAGSCTMAAGVAVFISGWI